MAKADQAKRTRKHYQNVARRNSVTRRAYRQRKQTIRTRKPSHRLTKRTRRRLKKGSGILDQVRGMFTAAPSPPSTSSSIPQAEQQKDLRKFTKVASGDPGQMPSDIAGWGSDTFSAAARQNAVRRGRVLDLSPDPAIYSDADYKTMAKTYSRWFPSANNIPNFSKTCTENADRRPQPTDRLVYFDRHFPGVEFPIIQMANISADTIKGGETDPNVLPMAETRELGADGKANIVYKPITLPYSDMKSRAVKVTPEQKKAEMYPGQMSERAAILRLYPKLGEDGASFVQMERLKAYEWLMARVRALLSRQCAMLAAKAEGSSRPADEQDLESINAEFRKLKQLYDQHGLDDSGDRYAGFGPIGSPGTDRLVRRYMAMKAMINAKTKVGSELTAGKLDVDGAQAKSRMIETTARSTMLDPRPPASRAMSADTFSSEVGFSPITAPESSRPRSVPLPETEGWLDRAHNAIGSYLAPQAKEQPKTFTVGGSKKRRTVRKMRRANRKQGH